MRQVVIVCDRCEKEKRQSSSIVRGSLPISKLKEGHPVDGLNLEVVFNTDVDLCAECMKWFVQNCEWKDV